MNKIKIPIGRSGFADIRENGYYFVDKSGLIEELLKTDATVVTLITRPRRFGKTLNMSMMSEFFDIRKDSKKLFAGLEITNNYELCANWLNQYPTLFLSFKSIDGLGFFGAYAMLKAVMAKLYKDNLYLIESDKVNTFDKELFIKMAAKKASKEEIKNALLVLTQLMSVYYGKPVILFIDEYDVPLAKASEKGYYTEMLDVMKGIMQVIKDNNALKFAVITGCLRIAKESIFTGTNNFVSDTISNTRLSEYFGFTQVEVDGILRNTGLINHAKEIKEWYDGYHFGDCDIYCPWDVMNHINNLMLNPQTKPIGYWKNSSDNAIIRSFIDFSGETITQKLETLLSHGYIIQEVKDDLTYDYINSSEENLWSILYLTGYLTKLRKGYLKKSLPQDNLALTIPNAEIMEIFESTIRVWFEESVQKLDRKALFTAIWNKNVENATNEVSKLLRRTISYHDYKEDFYHAFFAGIFAGAGYIVESNKEHGEGRSDIIVKDYRGDRIAIFEVKYSKSLKDLTKDCERAITQINDRMYAEEFEDNYSQIICYGISFFKKRCLIQKK